MLYILAAAAIGVFYLVWRYSFLVPASAGLPVLMYHNVHAERKDGLTVAVDQFAAQCKFLHDQGYKTLSLAELLSDTNPGGKLPPRCVVLTFDDGYANLLPLALPLLEQYRLKASIFLPVGLIGQDNRWDGGGESLLDVPALRELGARGLEFGLHSFLHENYRNKTAEQIGQDVQRCRQELDRLQIPYAPVLAYPYGAYARDADGNAAMKQVLRQTGIQLALRIGNRVNRWPLRDPWEVKRIDIRGTDSEWRFRTKLRKGRVQLF